MRRLLPLLACLTALVPLGLVAAGCGEDESFSVSAAEAAKATRAEEAAKVTFKADVQGAGLPVPISLKGQGVSAISDAKMDLTFDFGSLLQLAGAKVADGKARVLLDGGDVWVDPPAVEGLDLPGGATWVTADLTELLKSAGVDASGYGELMRLTPDQQLAALEAADGIKEVGKEEINGEQTVHLKGTLKLDDYLEVLPPDRRAEAEKAIEELKKLPGTDGSEFETPQNVDMWIGEDKLLRRMISSMKTPAQQGVPAMSMKITMDMSDYGTKLDVTPPAADETYDATKDLSTALKQTARQQGLPTN
jgi:hypothetical protein